VSSILSGGVRNSSPAIAGSPFRSANKRVSGSGFQLSPKTPSAISDTRWPLSEIGGKVKYKDY